jgi:hypothetical protein
MIQLSQRKKSHGAVSRIPHDYQIYSIGINLAKSEICAKIYFMLLCRLFLVFEEFVLQS